MARLIVRPSPGFHLNPAQREASKVLALPIRNTMFVGGARAGKTLLFTKAIFHRALRAPSRHAILRFRSNATWPAVGLQTIPMVVEKCFPGLKLKPHIQLQYFTLPNGSEIWLGGLDEQARVERILGNEYLTLFLSECSQIPWPSVVIALSRLAQKVPGITQKAFFDLNPVGTGHWSYKLFFEKREPDSGRMLENPDDYQYVFINPRDNEENLDPSYLDTLRNLPEKQRKRFYEGIYQPQVEGALWEIDTIERSRVDPADVPALTRVVVGVDPSGASGPADKRSDEIGISVCGLGEDNRGYILADATMKGSPNAWGSKAIESFLLHKADAIVAEDNYGGEMVRHVIQTAAKDRGIQVPVKKVSATRGKVVRAEPIAGLFEQDRIRIVGKFPLLEDQMLNMSSSGYRGHRSPDRVDAAIWSLSALMLHEKPAWMSNRRSPAILPIYLR